MFILCILFCLGNNIAKVLYNSLIAILKSASLNKLFETIIWLSKTIEPDFIVGNSYCETIVFDTLLEQLLLFENDDRTKSDAVIAAMITLCCALEPVNTYKKVNSPLVKTY